MSKNPFIREDDNYTIDDIKLFPSQNEGVKFILSNFNCIINHQPGLRKNSIISSSYSTFFKSIYYSTDSYTSTKTGYILI